MNFKPYSPFNGARESSVFHDKHKKSRLIFRKNTFLAMGLNYYISGGVAKWLTRWTSNLRIAVDEGSNPDRHVVVSLGKKLYTHCLVLVGSRMDSSVINISCKNLFRNRAINQCPRPHHVTV